MTGSRSSLSIDVVPPKPKPSLSASGLSSTNGDRLDVIPPKPPPTLGKRGSQEVSSPPKVESRLDVTPPKPKTVLSVLADRFGAPPTIAALGVDPSGQYFRPPITSGEFAWRASSSPIKPGGGREPRVGVDPDDLAKAGWGVIFADPAAREALYPLLELRYEQAGKRFVEIEYTPGQSAQAFLNEHHAPPGPADPERAIPYYLTLVGDPEAIPFDFQQELDVRYAVGRISFDRPEEYAAYAQAVVAAERGELYRERTAAFFGAGHPNDPITELCNTNLVHPLAAMPLRDDHWRAQVNLGAAADSRALQKLLGGAERPAFLLTAGHGLVLSKDHGAQRHYQGALLTADWPGGREVEEEHVFTASEIPGGDSVQGLVAALVGCHTAGTPRFDTFNEGEATELTEAPFVAALPKKLLAQGALAVLGHVDSLYLHTFAWPGAGDQSQHQTFETLLFKLLAGHRLGHAVDTFGRRYGELSARLLAARLDPGSYSVEEYASYWIGYHDARQYIVLGDPAVRLAVG